MTVKELIETLKKYPEDTQVLVSGYEGGYVSFSMGLKDVYLYHQERLGREVYDEKFYPFRDANQKEFKALILERSHENI